jgi:hypothetical protein
MKQKIKDKMYEIYVRDFYTCRHPDCSRPATEIAHGISKGKYGQKAIKEFVWKAYGIELDNETLKKIIHHEKNLWASCRSHNDYFVIPFYSLMFEKQVNLILKEMRLIT